MYLKWLLKVIAFRAVHKGHIVLLDQSTKGTLEAQRARCPLVKASKNTGSRQYLAHGKLSPFSGPFSGPFSSLFRVLVTSGLWPGQRKLM